LQRQILRKVIQLPLKKPYFWIASYPNWEHVGVKRQAGGVTCEMVPWYSLIDFRATVFSIFYQQIQTVEQFYYRPVDLMVVQANYRPPGDQYDIPPGLYNQQAYILFEQPFDTVSDSRFPNTFGYRETRS
jgi:hypothetical protein